MNIPFVDLHSQYISIKSSIDDAIADVIKETAFIGGKHVKVFEERFRGYFEAKYCIGCANGTDAIYIILKMLGIGIGDEVITTGHSWISTAETIGQTGAKPVFVDTEPDYFTIDPNKIEQKITARTRAIIPVHLYGQAADMDEIMRIANKHRLFVIEDCAQSHFTTYKGKKVGTFGIASTFSFYPGKNLGAYGDAGCIITNDDILAEKCRMYANHGALIKHQHKIEGINSRLDGLQAAILTAKLPHLTSWNQKRVQHANYYSELLKHVPGITVPSIRTHTVHTFHLYVVKARNRTELQSVLTENGIETALHYPVQLPFLDVYKHMNHNKADFPVITSYQDEILSLPMYPELQRDQIDYIADIIKKFYQR